MNRIFCRTYIVLQEQRLITAWFPGAKVASLPQNFNLLRPCHTENPLEVREVKPPETFRPLLLNDLKSTASAEKRKKQFLKSIQTIFRLSLMEAEEISSKYPFLWQQYSLTTLLYLYSHGLSKSSFICYPWLSSELTDEMDLKMKEIKISFPDFNINTCAPLLKMPLKKLSNLLIVWREEAVDYDFMSKFHFLSQKLEAPIDFFLSEMLHKKFLENLPYSKIIKAVDLLLGGGVSKAQIVSDLWVLRYSPEIIQSRIESARKAGISVKPWIIRCTNQDFDNCARGRIHLQLLPDPTTYLSSRLKCDPSVVSTLIKKYPSLKRTRSSCLISILDFFSSKGIEEEKIRVAPFILRLNFETIKRRVEMIESLGIELKSIDSLNLLCRPENAIKKYFEQYKRNRQIYNNDS